MNRLKGIAAYVWILVSLLDVACATPTSCEPITIKHEVQDATQLPYRSFVLLQESFKFVECSKKNPKECKDNEGQTYASGVIVKKSDADPRIAIIMTADHFCLAERTGQVGDIRTTAKVLRVYDSYGIKHEANVLTYSESSDLCAVVIFDAFDLQAVTISSSIPKMGERLYNLAAPRKLFGPDAIVTFEGFFSGVMENMYLLTVPAVSGSSGSAVFNARGELVSIIRSVPTFNSGDGQRQLMEHISYGIQLSAVRKFMMKIEDIDDDVKLQNMLSITPDIPTTSASRSLEHGRP